MPTSEGAIYWYRSRVWAKSQTNDYLSRLHEHNSGESFYTKTHRPWELILVLSKKTRSESMVLEKKIKNIGTNERLRAFIDKYKDTDCRFKDGDDIIHSS